MLPWQLIKISWEILKLLRLKEIKLKRTAKTTKTNLKKWQKRNKITKNKNKIKNLNTYYECINHLN